MMTDKEQQHVIDGLKNARAELAMPGRWGKGEHFSGTSGQVCAVEACSIVTTWGREHLFAELRADLDPRWELSIVFFNDADETTLEDVLALFDRTIERLESAQ